MLFETLILVFQSLLELKTVMLMIVPRWWIGTEVRSVSAAGVHSTIRVPGFTWVTWRNYYAGKKLVLT